MFKGAIHYKGSWLAPGSLCHRLYTEGKRPELDKLMKELDEKDRKLTNPSKEEKK